MLVLPTPRTVESKYVTWEWENALTLQKRVVPLLILSYEVPDELARLHCHDLSQPDSYVLGFAALVRDLAKAVTTRTKKVGTEADPSAASFTVFGADRSAIGPHATVINQGPDEPANSEWQMTQS